MNCGDVGNYGATSNQRIRGKSKPRRYPSCGGMAKALVNTRILVLDASFRLYVPSGSRIPPHERIKEVEHAAELARGVYRHVKCLRVV